MGWEEIAASKRAEREARTQRFLDQCADSQRHGSVSELLPEIADVNELQSSYAKGRLSVEEVVVAYINRAIAAQEKTNCLTEVLFLEALQEARRQDQHYRTHGTLVGPLHGVPMSLKDQFDVTGFDTTIGYGGRSYGPARSDASLVKILRRLGAIIITKTNVPQSILWGETENPIWGLTTLPQRSDFTPGGSSGGEAALLALGGACCGWGTDIGGSIRGPCHFNGLFGLKPSSARISHQGAPGPHEGQEHVPSSVGPMAPSLTTLVSVTKEVLNSQGCLDDPRVVPIPWREDIYQEAQTRKLRIGLIQDDGIVEPHPPIFRALRAAITLLEAAGHEIVPWDTSDHIDCIKIQDKFYRADGGVDIRSAVLAGGEPLMPHVEALVADSKPISVYEYWQLNKAKMEAQQAYNTKWTESGVDVLIGPVAAHTAIPHRSFRWTGYTKLFNFLDYSALAFPMTTASPKLDVPVTNGANRHFRSSLDEHNRRLYDPVSMDGLPVGIQIVGRRFNEEFVLGVAAALHREMQKQGTKICAG